MKEFYHGTLFAKILDKSPVRIYSFSVMPARWTSEFCG